MLSFAYTYRKVQKIFISLYYSRAGGYYFGYRCKDFRLVFVFNNQLLYIGAIIS